MLTGTFVPSLLVANSRTTSTSSNFTGGVVVSGSFTVSFDFGRYS